MTRYSRILGGVLIAVLAGCGGGGGGGSSTGSVDKTWNGIYTEYSSSHCLTVTTHANGTFSGLAEDGTDTIYPVTGTSSASGFSFTANGLSYNGAFTSTKPDGSIDGTMTLAFGGSMPPVTGSLHLDPFTNSAYQGSWSGPWSDNAGMSGTLALTISATGALSGTLNVTTPALSSSVAGASGTSCFTFTYDFGGGSSGFIYGKGISIDPVSHHLVGSFTNSDGASGQFSLGTQ